MGNVLALFIEKSRRVAPGTTPGGTSIENDMARTSGQRSRRWRRRRWRIARWPDKRRAWRRCPARAVRPGQDRAWFGDVEDFELGPHADTLRVRATRERPLPGCRRLRLDGQHPRMISSMSAASVGLFRSTPAPTPVSWRQENGSSTRSAPGVTGPTAPVAPAPACSGPISGTPALTPISTSIVRNGIAGTEMPGFQWSLTDTMTWRTAAYVRSLGRRPAEPVRGDPTRGAAIYEARAARPAT